MVLLGGYFILDCQHPRRLATQSTTMETTEEKQYDYLMQAIGSLTEQNRSEIVMLVKGMLSTTTPTSLTPTLAEEQQTYLMQSIGDLTKQNRSKIVLLTEEMLLKQAFGGKPIVVVLPSYKPQLEPRYKNLKEKLSSMTQRAIRFMSLSDFDKLTTTDKVYVYAHFAIDGYTYGTAVSNVLNCAKNQNQFSHVVIGYTGVCDSDEFADRFNTAKKTNGYTITPKADQILQQVLFLQL
jgi:hypothetical protein